MLLLLDRLFNKISTSMLIKTKVGIKPLNQIICSKDFLHRIIYVKTNLDIKKIIAPPDFLIDKFTLVGKRIPELPHYELIKFLDKKLSLDNCDYVHRSRNGTLDFRKKVKISKDRLQRIYSKKIAALNKGDPLRVKVCLVYENTFMVCDGKHSLAMADYFNITNIQFEIIPNMIFDTYINWIFKKIKNNNDYLKHNEFFRRVYEFRKKEINRITKGLSEE